MNALEFADALYLDYSADSVTDSADMLRKQMVEIDRLTEKCDWLLSTPPYYSGYSNGFKAGIAFATRRINGMPNHQDGFSRGEVLRAIDDKIRGEK